MLLMALFPSSWREAAYSLVLHHFLSGLGPAISVINQENIPLICLQDNSREAVSLLGFLNPDSFKFVSS